MWFPEMRKTVDLFVETCLPCQAAEPATGQLPMTVTELPPSPWHTVHADYKGPVGGQYMVHVVVDAYSRFADVEVTKSTTGEELMPKLDKLWATHGIPTRLVSDNGPPYKSREFRKYCKKMGIKHRPITETHPQSNGIAERFVKRIVKLILTAKIDGKDPRREVNKFVMGYNSATHSSTGKAPVDLLMNRSVRTLLPGLPQPLDEDRDRQVRETDRAKKEYNKEYKDRRMKAKEKEVRIGDEVLIKQKKTSIKPPFDPKPFQVKSVSKSRVNLERDDGK